MPRPDDPARGGRRRGWVAAARHKPDLVAQLVSKSRLEPNIPPKFRLIAQATILAIARAQSQACPIAQPGAEPIADAPLSRPDRIANADAGDHLRIGRPDG